MTSYFDHHHGSRSRIESDTVDCPDMLVSEAHTSEERAAFIWTWNQLAREDARAALILEGASHG